MCIYIYTRRLFTLCVPSIYLIYTLYYSTFYIEYYIYIVPTLKHDCIKYMTYKYIVHYLHIIYTLKITKIHYDLCQSTYASDHVQVPVFDGQNHPGLSDTQNYVRTMMCPGRSNGTSASPLLGSMNCSTGSTASSWPVDRLIIHKVYHCM